MADLHRGRHGVAEDPQAVPLAVRARGGSSGGGGADRRAARGGASGRRSGRSGRRRPPPRRPSRWGWRGRPRSAGSGRRRRSGGRPGPPTPGVEGRGIGSEELPLAVARRAARSARRRSGTGERPASAAGGPSATRTGPSRCASGSPARGRAAGQEPGLDQDLEAVADPQDQAAPVVEPAEGVAEDGPQPGREDPAGAEVVAVREAAGERQDLEGIERRRAAPGRRPTCQISAVGAGQLPGGGRLLVAVRPGGRRTIRARGVAISSSRSLGVYVGRLGSRSRRGRPGCGGSGRPHRPARRSRRRS